MMKIEKDIIASNKVLLVDDDPEELLATSRVLIKAGFEVTGADSALSAIDKARRNVPDIILLDVVMPEIDGFEACQMIKADSRLSESFVVLMSSQKNTPDYQARGLDAGADGFIPRPFYSDEFVARIRSMMRIKSVEKELRLQKQWLRVTMSSIGDALIATDNRSRILFMNKVAENLTGWTMENAELQPLSKIFNIIDGTTNQPIADPISRVMKDGVIIHLQDNVVLVNKNNMKHQIADSAAPIRNDDGTIVGGVLVFRDITDRKNAEKEKEELENQLQQAQKMEAIGTLAGGVAHDFNNLLQAINGYTQLLLMEKSDNDPDYSSLKAIHKACFRASDLVRQLLLFSRKADSSKRPIDIPNEVEQAKKILERTIPKMVQIQVHTEARLWSINADPVQIEQMLLNLGTNAADAMPNGGRLLFKIENTTLDDEYAKLHMNAKRGKYVLLTVSDTGHGMDTDTIKNIFDPFFTTKEPGKGTGLGLASVYGIVKSHGGYIFCNSEVGQGTTFKIYLPAIVQPEVEQAESFEPERIPHGTETILLVDDEEAIRSFVQQVLSKFGYTVMAASTGEEALKVYTAKPNEIDLVTMDLGMPGMGGHKCLIELLNFNPEAKVIITSGYSFDLQVKKSMEAGAKGYIGKPYQVTDLLNTVRAVLDKKK